MGVALKKKASKKKKKGLNLLTICLGTEYEAQSYKLRKKGPHGRGWGRRTEFTDLLSKKPRKLPLMDGLEGRPGRWESWWPSLRAPKDLIICSLLQPGKCPAFPLTPPSVRRRVHWSLALVFYTQP